MKKEYSLSTKQHWQRLLPLMSVLALIPCYHGNTRGYTVNTMEWSNWNVLGKLSFIALHKKKRMSSNTLSKGFPKLKFKKWPNSLQR